MTSRIYLRIQTEIADPNSREPTLTEFQFTTAAPISEVVEAADSLFALPKAPFISLEEI